MISFLDFLSPEERHLIKKQKMPQFIPVMLATLTEKRFSDPSWIFERKLDGIRCLVFKKGKNIVLKSRNDNDISETYPEIVKAFKAFDAPNIIVDGELVAFEGDVTSFKKLQQRLGIKNAQSAQGTGVKVYFYIFDLLYCDGYDISQLPLITRKTVLKKIMPFKKPLYFTSHIDTAGEKYYQQACKKGWEGVIAKYRYGKYIHKRSPEWLKFKCTNEQELVIGGYTDPGGSRTGFGALLLGYYKNNQLQYAGKVGTGFDTKTLEMLAKKLKKITTNKNPFSTDSMQGVHTHFVRPLLVAQVGFFEWTQGNKLRHSRFLGLRTDKNPKEVVQEL